MAKKEFIEYKGLSESSRKRLASFAERVHKVGTTASKVKKMSDQEIRDTFQTKAKDLDAFRKLARQLTQSKERRQETVKRAIKSYERQGWKGTKLEQIKKELVKASGSVFDSMSDDLQKKKGLSEKDSYKRTRELLALPEKEYDKLDQTEKEVLDDHDYRAGKM